MSGYYAAGPPDGEANLVGKARDALRAYLRQIDAGAPPVAVLLEKNLPIASGIGGGSADAAATLRALVRLWNAAVTPAELNDLARSVGGGRPMCLASRPLSAEGIGDRIRPARTVPDLRHGAGQSRPRRLYAGRVPKAALAREPGPAGAAPVGQPWPRP